MTGDVTVTGGLFNVQLGGGNIVDGATMLPDDPYTSLSEVFRDHAEVWMQIEIDPAPAGGGFEVLSTRTRVLSVASAFNADHLDGVDSSGFIDTSAMIPLDYAARPGAKSNLWPDQRKIWSCTRQPIWRHSIFSDRYTNPAG